MAIVINGSGTVTGLAVGGLPDDSVDAGSLANSINSEITANTAKTGITSSQATAITAALPKAGGTMTGVLVTNNKVGIAVVPETWSITSALQIGADTALYNDSGYSILSNNAYFNSGNKYINSGTANRFVLNDDGSMDFETAPSGSADAAITFTERVRIHTNGVTSIPAGVALGVGTANTASNVLNDYEEGTWTPALASNTTSCSMGSVYTSHYTKIGNVVKLYTSFDIDSSANPATGVLRFTGFPFALKTLGEGSFLISLYYNYKVAPMVFMSKGGYTYYTNTTVNGNNLRNLTETIGQNTTNVMGMQFSYLTDA